MGRAWGATRQPFFERNGVNWEGREGPGLFGLVPPPPLFSNHARSSPPPQQPREAGSPKRALYPALDSLSHPPQPAQLRGFVFFPRPFPPSPWSELHQPVADDGNTRSFNAPAKGGVKSATCLSLSHLGGEPLSDAVPSETPPSRKFRARKGGDPLTVSASAQRSRPTDVRGVRRNTYTHATPHASPTSSAAGGVFIGGSGGPRPAPPRGRSFGHAPVSPPRQRGSTTRAPLPALLSSPLRAPPTRPLPRAAKGAREGEGRAPGAVGGR